MIVQLALSLALQAPQAPHPPDTWFGSDKLKHFFIAAFTQSVSYSLLQTARVDHGRALVGASVVTAAVSIAKEVYDHRSYGLFSGRDLVWDAAGAGVATLVIHRAVRTQARTGQTAGSSVIGGVPLAASLLSHVRPGPILARRAQPTFAPRRPSFVR